MVLLFCAVRENGMTGRAAFPVLWEVSEGNPALTWSVL